ncbi:hypothetical protein MLPM_2253 [Mycobacterium lepromatosis]|uniref:Uncharacterized protein n=1 Tax=Mycobacterium lepromatosis TaxID=480418 RepID=A0A0F4EP11_9MYCO|nr:hypothetical protein MLPM_2253 [Mycobacterium lepromatosis]
MPTTSPSQGRVLAGAVTASKKSMSSSTWLSRSGLDISRKTWSPAIGTLSCATGTGAPQARSRAARGRNRRV